jgi:hypothetical protein
MLCFLTFRFCKLQGAGGKLAAELRKQRGEARKLMRQP